MIAVEELARLLVSLPTSNALTRQVIEPDDGRPDGWDHRELARAIGIATDSNGATCIFIEVGAGQSAAGNPAACKGAS